MVDGMYSSSSRTIWFYTVVLAVIALILFAVAPVSADVIRPVDPTKVFFERDGTPVNETVAFRVNCFGYHSSSGKPPVPSQNLEPENVFWFSGTCPSYGCVIFERYYLANRYITSCDLEGQLNGENFIIRNFANTPKPKCTNPQIKTIVSVDYLHPENSTHTYYHFDDRYQACLDTTAPPKGTPENYDKREAREKSCIELYGVKINWTDIVKNDRGDIPRDEVCTLRFTIPPERYVPTPTPAIHTPTPSQNSPISGYVILVSVAIAAGMAGIIGKKRTR